MSKDRRGTNPEYPDLRHASTAGPAGPPASISEHDIDRIAAQRSREDEATREHGRPSRWKRLFHRAGEGSTPKARERPVIEVRGSGGVYFVEGELDVSTAERFRHELEPALDAEGELVLDLTELTFVDSFGLRTIALLARMVGDRGVVLRYPRDEVLRVLDLLDIEDVPGIRVERW